MSLSISNLIRPVAEQLREQSLHPEASGYREEIEANSASAEEMAAVWNNIPVKDARVYIHRFSEWEKIKVPSIKNAGKPETRVVIRHLTRKDQRRLKLIRRNAGVPKKPKTPGLVLRGDDPRMALTWSERDVIKGLYLNRSEPSPAHILRRLVRDCIRCESAPMEPEVPGARGRYRVWLCTNPACNLKFGYRTIHRICVDEIRPEIKTRARKGINAAIDAHGIYRIQRAANFYRNERVYGDNHQLDLLLWDKNDPKMELFRPWISACQDRASSVVEYRLGVGGESPNSDFLRLAFRAYVIRRGRPTTFRCDNGHDYKSKAFEKFCADLGVEISHTLVSQRGGESHGKSKPIERWFGTLERDFIRTLDGGVGTHPKERPEDLLHGMRKRHEAYIAAVRRGEKATTPFYPYRISSRDLQLG
jgi:transposase InsO family protein